jgi:hypothetical protein
LKYHYAKFKKPVSYTAEDQFKGHDKDNYYRDIHEPNPNAQKNAKKIRPVTKKLFGDSDSAYSKDDEVDLQSPIRDHPGKPENANVRQLSMQEIEYLIKIYKNKTEKWHEPHVVKEVRAQASFTAKMLTKDTVEGAIPMCLLIERYSSEGIQGLRTLLYRCSRLYSIR